MGTIKTTNIEPIADNGTVTLGSSGDQFTLATGAKSSFLYPAFEAYLGSDQTLSSGVTTKVNINTEVYDTDGYYDNATNYRFTPLVAGKYFVYAGLKIQTASDFISAVTVRLYKNGAEVVSDTVNAGGTAYFDYMSVSTSVTLDLSVNDYVELYGYIDNAANTDSSFRDDYGSVATYFQGYRLIGV